MSDIQIHVVLFAGAKAAMGTGSIELTIPRDSTVQQLLDRIGSAHPGLKDLLQSSRIAIDTHYVDNAHRLSCDTQCMLIPPVSGG